MTLEGGTMIERVFEARVVYSCTVNVNTYIIVHTSIVAGSLEPCHYNCVLNHVMV